MKDKRKAGPAHQRILLVDDDKELQVLLAAWLSSEEVEVESVLDGEEALASISRSRPDLVLLDLTMPGMDGFGVLEKLRQGPDQVGFPVLVLTADSREDTLLRAFEAGADDFLSKPITRPVLLARIKAHLRVRGLQERVREDGENMRRQLELGRRFQNAFLPSEVTERPGLRVVSKYVPALEVSGDFFDIVPGGEGSTDVVVADVTGHGVAASLFTAFLKAFMWRGITGGQFASAAVLVRELNQDFLRAFGETGVLVSLVILRFLANRREVEVVRAGHAPALLVPKQGDLRLLGEPGPVIGMDPESAYLSEVFPVSYGDRIYLHTDGLSEATNDSRSVIEGDRILGQMLVANRDQSLDEVLARTLATALEGSEAKSNDDDITLLGVEVI